MARMLTIILIAALRGCASREPSELSDASNPLLCVLDAHVYMGREVRMPGAYAWTNGMPCAGALNLAP